MDEMVSYLDRWFDWNTILSNKGHLMVLNNSQFHIFLLHNNIHILQQGKKNNHCHDHHKLIHFNFFVFLDLNLFCKKKRKWNLEQMKKCLKSKLKGKKRKREREMKQISFFFLFFYWSLVFFYVINLKFFILMRST